MQLTTVPLSTLLPPKDNPRRVIDKTLIAGLAQSIRSGEILQNLLVRPEGEGTYRVVFGKRRYLALQLLKKEGAIDGDYQVPVGIKEGLTDDDARWLSTIENAQREQLHPLDEGEDFARLLQLGGSLDVLTERTGLSAATVKRRLALATLAPEVKKVFRAGAIGRSVAEALSLGSREQQRAILESLESEEPPDVEDIREMFLAQKPTLAMAVFPRERYTGTLTTDLFADEETTYFDDVDQFLALQREAVEVLAAERRNTAAFVEVLNLYTVPWWQFREAEADEPSGLVINLHPSGAVEIRDGLALHDVEQPVVQATRTSPIAPRPARERPAFGAELLRYVAYQRSAAMQAALLANPRKGKEAAVVLLLLGFRRNFGVQLAAHACHAAPPAERGQRSHQSIEAVAVHLATRLGFNDSEATGTDDRQDGVTCLLDSPDALVISENVGRLSDEELDRLLVLLPLLCLGQDHLDSLDSGDSLLNRMAAGAGVALRSWWTPDAAFLGLLTREHLIGVAKAAGAAEHLTGMNGWTKKRLVEELTTYFADRADPQKEDGQQAREWLPGLLRFPAVKAIAEDIA